MRNPVMACRGLMAFIEKYGCTLRYPGSGKDADAEDGALDEIGVCADLSLQYSIGVLLSGVGYKICEINDKEFPVMNYKEGKSSVRYFGDYEIALFAYNVDAKEAWIIDIDNPAWPEA